jgi:hypothetical protein
MPRTTYAAKRITAMARATPAPSQATWMYDSGSVPASWNSWNEPTDERKRLTVPGTIATVAIAYTSPIVAITQSRTAATETTGGRPAGAGGAAAGGGRTGYDIDDSQR